MSTYVVGDIHGCYNEWITLKNKIESMDKDARFILIGDIVDRGRQVMQMIDWALHNVEPGGKYQMILGNHEDMKINWAKQYSKYKDVDFSKTQHFKHFDADGYDFQYNLIASDVTDDYVIKIIEFFKSLPLFIDLDVTTESGRNQYYVICHAALSNNVLDDNGRIDRTQCRENHDSFNKVLDEYILWERNYWGNNWNYDTIVVHGHTPTCTRDLAVRGSNPGRIDFRRKDINVDCGMCFGIEVSNLAAICLETLDEYYAVDTEDCSLAAMSNSEAYKKDMLHFIKTGHDIEEQSLDVEDTKIWSN